jgi:anti-anti-sigma factor
VTPNAGTEARRYSGVEKHYEIIVLAGTGPPVVEVTGELDLTSEADLGTALAEARQRGAQVVIDLRDASFIDARTVDVLYTAHQTGTDLAVRGAHGMPRRVLEVVGASAWIDLMD